MTMDFDEFQALVEALLAEHAGRGYPATIRILDGVRATDEEIAAAERLLGTQLPFKYKQVMTTYGGGMFGFVDLLPVKARDGGLDDLLSANSGEFAINDFVAVAPVGSGDMWGFENAGGICADAVSVWDHETGDIAFDADDFLLFLASRGVRGDRGPT